MGKQALDFSQFLTEKLHVHGFSYAYTIHWVVTSLFSISDWVPALVPCVVAPNLRVSAYQHLKKALHKTTKERP